MTDKATFWTVLATCLIAIAAGLFYPGPEHSICAVDPATQTPEEYAACDTWYHEQNQLESGDY